MASARMHSSRLGLLLLGAAACAAASAASSSSAFRARPHAQMQFHDSGGSAPRQVAADHPMANVLLDASASQNQKCLHPFEPVPQLGVYDRNRRRMMHRIQGPNESDDFLMILGAEYSGSPARQNHEFSYFSGWRFSDSVLLVDFRTKSTTLFLARRSRQFIIFDGDWPPFETIVRDYDVDAVHYTEHLLTWLAERTVGTIHTVNAAELARRFPAVDGFYTVDARWLPLELPALRCEKQPEEVEMLRVACGVSSAAHTAVLRHTRPGWNELHVSTLFEHECQNCHLRFMGYNSIAGAGKNAAVLHYIDNNEIIKEDDIILIDASAEYMGYTCDITRSWPANGTFSERQRLIYQIVLDSQQAGLKALRADVRWSDVTKAAAVTLLEGLLRAGFVRGTVAELSANGIAGVFMPHSLGHSIGLAVHDPCSTMNSAPLKAGMVFTVEPGVYFIDLIMQETRRNAQRAKFINWDMVDAFMDFGGVRIEDVVAVTKDGVDYLSTTPRTIDDIERARAEPYRA